jgi:hypothetical protein
MNVHVLRMPGIKELPRTAANKAVRSIMDTMLLTPEGVARWKRPPFQRELRVTPRVLGAVEELKANGGVISGVLTLGKLGTETYLLDGQHRVEAFKLSEQKEGIADVRICTFESMADMGDEFVRLNSALVRMTNDDVLRGLEGSNEHLQLLRKRCPFIGYSHVRASSASNAKLLTMSTTIRVWFGSAGQTPTPGPSSTECVKLIDAENVDRLTKMLSIAYEAWGHDPESFRMWGSLNLSMSFWLWRRLVLRQGLEQRRGGHEIVTLSADEFRQCLMAVAANSNYLDWLLGRGLRDRDRSPAYNRVKQIFVGRLGGMGFGRATLPIPDWASH